MAPKSTKQDDQNSAPGAVDSPPVQATPPADTMAPQPAQLTAVTPPKRWWDGFGVEWLVIILLVTIFCAGILDLRAQTELPGNEAEVFQMLDWTLVNSLRQYHAFPLWNMYVQTGLPFVADPMLHAYNPVVTLPVLLFGVRAGFKLAVYFSFLIAAFGMWRLALTLGFGRAARLYTALMFAFAGQPVARFLQGQYLFIFGYAFIPWAVSSLVLVSRKLRRRDVAIAVGSLALLFFSGNAYYPMYMLLVIGLFLLVLLFSFKRKTPYISLDTRRFSIYLGIGVLMLGLIAIQLLPAAQFWPHLSKDLNLAGSQTIRQIYLDYTSKDSMRPDAYSQLPAREEFYAYIGLTPILGLAMLPLAFWKRDRRLLLFFILIVLLTVGWISLEWMPWKQAFLDTRFFLQFRHLLRILVFGSFALICLAGYGLDTLWKLLGAPQDGFSQSRWVSVLSLGGLGLLALFMLYGVGDVFSTNQFAVHSQAVQPASYQVMAWVRHNDLGDYYVRNNPNNAWQDAVLSSNLRYIDAWYHFADIRVLDGEINTRVVQAHANYLAQTTAEPVPEGGVQVATVDGYPVYSLLESLPMAYLVDNATLQPAMDAGPLTRSDVTPLVPFFSSPNNLEVIAEGSSDQTLVLMMTRYPGWQVLMDGKPQVLQNAGGYMAVALQPGVHKYTFVFSPRPFFIGLGLSLVSLAITLWLFISDIRVDARELFKKWRAAWGRLGETLRRPRTSQAREAPASSQAVYHQGMLALSQPLDLPEDASVSVLVEANGRPRGELTTAWQRWRWATLGMFHALSKRVSLEVLLFAAALLVYLLTRLIGLTQFPISFLGDEAAQTLYAQSLIDNHFHDPVTGLYLPMYVEAAGNRWTPLLPMYIQAVSLVLFGKSVLVTRGTAVIVGLLAAISVGMILKQIFKARLWWLGVLIVAITPAWFLHSRTAYETVMTTAFFAMFLWFYLRYRQLGASLIPGLVFLALTFYTYSNGQLIAVGAGVLLLLSDVRYHWQQRQRLLPAIPVSLLLALPFILFTLNKPAALTTHLRAVDSYWYHNIPVAEKLLTFLKNYAYGLSPAYWFFPNGVDLPRHRMLDISHLPIALLPFMLIGLLVCLRRVRHSRYRTLILAGLAVPLGASLVQIGITRELAFIVPAALVMALGIEWLWEQARARLRWPVKQWMAALPLFLILSGMSFSLLRTSLVKGPLWFNDYGLYGMQYGAIQIFEQAIPQYWRQDPNLHFRISSVWANGTERYLSYFLTKDEQQKVDLAGIDGLLTKKYTLEPNDIFVLTPSEYDQASHSPKLKTVAVDSIIPYPDGSPGFYFVRVAYSDNIDQLIAAEEAERKTLKEEVITFDGQPLTVRYSWLDMGIPAQIFDRDPFTFIRGMEANPFILELDFAQARQLSGLTLNLGAMDADLTVDLYADANAAPIRYQQSFRNVQEGDILTLKFADGPHPVMKLHLEIFSPYAGTKANVHIRELQLLP